MNIFEKLYNNVLITEIHSKYLETLPDEIDELPFDNIFDGKYRVVVPFGVSEKYSELKKELETLPNFISFNPSKKEVIVQVKIKGPQGEGTKNQALNIGTAISKLKVSPERKKELLNWFSNYSTNIQELEKLSKYSIILSRFPTDVIRMSDFDGVQSCHSVGGQYFHCAIQEAKSGGPIAYLVTTESLDTIDKKDFNNGEIFADKERYISGIDAISRVRIRRYVDTNKQEYAIPEVRVYGKKLSGFLDTVTNFLKEKQQLPPLEKIITLFKDKKIFKRGGSYGDSSDSELFNTFFETESMFGSLRHYSSDEDEEGDSESQTRADQFEEELSQYKANHASGLKHSYVDYDISDDVEEVYYTASGGMSIKIPEFDLSDLDLDINDPDDFEFYLSLMEDKHNTINTHHRTRDKSVEEKKEMLQISMFLNLFIKYAKLDRYDIANITLHGNKAMSSRESANVDNQTIEIWWNMGDQGLSTDTDDFRSLCQLTQSYDSKYEAIKRGLITALVKSKLIIADTPSVLNITNFDKFKNDQLEFVNLMYDDVREDFSLAIPKNVMNEVSVMQFDEIKRNRDNIHKLIANKLLIIYQMYRKTQEKSKESQLTFKQFTEKVNFVNVNQDVEVEVTIDPEAIRFGDNHNLYNLTFDISIKPIEIDKDIIEFMVYFDLMVDSFTRTYVRGILYKYIDNSLLNVDQQEEKQYLLKNIDK